MKELLLWILVVCGALSTLIGIVLIILGKISNEDDSNKAAILCIVSGLIIATLCGIRIATLHAQF